MPFEWVKEPTNSDQRKIDVAVKERIAKTMQPEFLFWACQLVPGLLSPKARVITPRPEKVREDLAMQFAASALSGTTIEATISPEDRGKQFVAECLDTWDGKERPSTRSEVQSAFHKWCANKALRVNPHDAFRGVLQGRNERCRQTYQKTNYEVYKRAFASATPGVNRVETVTLRPTPPNPCANA